MNETTFIRLGGWSSENEILLVAADGATIGLPPEVVLIKVETATGKRREIAKLKDTYLYNIHLSPDRKTIAFAAHREEKDNLWIMPADGAEMSARVVTLPVRDDVDRSINEQLIVELYSK